MASHLERGCLGSFFLWAFCSVSPLLVTERLVLPLYLRPLGSHDAVPPRRCAREVTPRQEAPGSQLGSLVSDPCSLWGRSAQTGAPPPGSCVPFRFVRVQCVLTDLRRVVWGVTHTVLDGALPLLSRLIGWGVGL